jgi:hypothetical protein
MIGVPVDDAILPAAAHLTGADARHVLDAALEAVGRTLERARPCHLHYRPGHDVVVRFDTRVRWAGKTAVSETLVASATLAGPPPDTLRVEATTDEGEALAVGVWRWPFDPVLPGLGDAVTSSTATRFLDGLAVGRARLDVVAYRPTQRAVVRAVDGAGNVFFIKVIAPAEVAEVVDRHRRMLEAGVPVPMILRDDPARGIIAMAALTGRTVRERIKHGHRRLPPPAEYEALYEALARVHLPNARRVTARTASGMHHAGMLAAVLPSERGRLDHLCGLLGPAARRARDRSGPTIHGDLYEGQLVTGRGAGQTDTIAGVLDLDDVGPGDPLDDRATVIAHLLNRTIDGRSQATRRIARYAYSLRSAFAERVDPVELDLATAGALVGLATGPFRTQQPRWPQGVRRRLDAASRLATRPGRNDVRIGL